DLSMEVIPTAFTNPWVEARALLLWSGANAFVEEIVVVMWLMTRLKHLGWSLPEIIGASSLLHGSYHLYRGVSAGFGNIIMCLVFCYFYHRTGRVWPLVIAHFLIDASLLSVIPCWEISPYSVCNPARILRAAADWF